MEKYKVGNRLIGITHDGYLRGITRGRLYKIIRYQYSDGYHYIHIRDDENKVIYYSESHFITELQYTDGFIDGIRKSVDYIPEAIVEFDNLFAVIMFQKEYGIWNTDGSFNPGRFDIFRNDYNSFLYREYLDSLVCDNDYYIY